MNNDFKETVQHVIREMTRTDLPTHLLEWADVWDIKFTRTPSGWERAQGLGFAGFGKTPEEALADWVKNAQRHVDLWQEYERLYTKHDIRRVACVVSDRVFADELMAEIDREIALLDAEKDGLGSL